ncbi:hypothetical protein ALC62_10783 [Cyphomyrmex costatus]|uniref:Uncharacterized protein n=1 Tax=Cyphomyrmex costatus TaxID=456900 RepID=A0A151IDU9_9HYME|nr:hypothetical protein ALC62_10783 [Cyphomyrmex costatus]
MDALEGNDFTVAELKDALRERKLPTGGAKAELIMRLEAVDEDIWTILDERRNQAPLAEGASASTAEQEVVEDAMMRNGGIAALNPVIKRFNDPKLKKDGLKSSDARTETSSVKGKSTKCYKYQETGHIATHCKRPVMTASVERRACFVCGSVKHLARDCSERKQPASASKAGKGSAQTTSTNVIVEHVELPKPYVVTLKVSPDGKTGNVDAFEIDAVIDSGSPISLVRDSVVKNEFCNPVIEDTGKFCGINSSRLEILNIFYGEIEVKGVRIKIKLFCRRLLVLRDRACLERSVLSREQEMREKILEVTRFSKFGDWPCAISRSRLIGCCPVPPREGEEAGDVSVRGPQSKFKILTSNVSTKNLERFPHNKYNIKSVPSDKISIGEGLYRVCSAIYHHRNSVNSGHYMNMLRIGKTNKSKWIYVSDQTILRKQWPRGSKDAYMFFLEKLK